jgi:hypothetical protein
MVEPVNSFNLSPQQKETTKRLSAGAYDLHVSKPMAGHALRELESLIRSVLIVPMQVVPPKDLDFAAKLKKARKALREIGFHEKMIDGGIKGLQPTEVHKSQIARLVIQLGLEPEGEVAKQWMTLCENFGNAHKRSFHAKLEVDDDFRQNFQQPFDTVIYAVVLAIRSRYAALMRQVHKLAASTDYERSVSSFKATVPGALPLQWHFYSRLTTEAWLPVLMKADLLGEPSNPLPENAGGGRYFGEWPAGSYLLKMAESMDDKSRRLVVVALANVADSDHPDVSQNGIAILAALPTKESAPVIHLAVAWMSRDTRVLRSQAPLDLVRKLSETHQPVAALNVAREILRLWGDNGQILSHFERHMYEHHLPDLVTMLTTACGRDALQLFVDLLHDAERISGNKYAHFSSQPISELGMPANDIFEALIIAVRTSAELLIRANLVPTRDVMATLKSEAADIFVRLSLHILSLDPAAVPDLATTRLLDAELIEQGWSNPALS